MTKLLKTNYKNSTQWLDMVGSQARGTQLVKSGSFGADMLRFEPLEQTSLHTHQGNHILFVVLGMGELEFNGEIYELNHGDCYYVPGNVPHQIKASYEGMFLLAVSDNHQSVDSSERLEIVE